MSDTKTRKRKAAIPSGVLRLFCAKKDEAHRYPGIRNPFRAGVWVYWTDGRACVRMHYKRSPVQLAKHDFSNDKIKAPKAIGEIFDGIKERKRWKPLDVSMSGFTHENRLGFKSERVRFNGKTFSLELYLLLCKLPNVRYSRGLSKEKFQWFVFDGGQGIIANMEE